ncbi:MAG: 2,3-bisphosphoglycerate-independent phosphoglycerate mutase [candidate division Zixibacteria bacterium]|nr:2,3-bisphosphoglycerate-independent phosphoglycerate mutase [candidate division Zixibacteria bacterium]
MLLLMILDGYGIAPPGKGNAISLAQKPNLDRLFGQFPHTQLGASGLAVGLPEGQMGNSEVGHLNFGAGRIVYQEITRIDKAVDTGEFFDNQVLNDVLKEAAAERKNVHLLGLVSDGGVHSSMKHLDALIESARREQIEKLFLHAFMDGRDTSPTSGAGFMEERVARFKAAGVGEVATLMGRYWGMDRDKRWDRVEKAYQAIIERNGVSGTDPVAAIRESYAAGVTDEFIEPVALETRQPVTFNNNDLCIFFNFRADRVRQLSSILAKQTESSFPHPELSQLKIMSMTLYDEKIKIPIIFPPQRLENIFAAVLSDNGKRSLKIAETEKYPHVTYFFNGGEEVLFDGEERELINSPKVATYDLQPEMSAPQVAAKCAEHIRRNYLDVVVLNFANPDMVGHTGIIPAAVKAIEAVDAGVGVVMSAVEDVGGRAFITADHGNAEKMIDSETGRPFTAHTTNPVPLLYYDKKYRPTLRQGGVLADVAPTMLELLDLKAPPEMTGKSFFS